MKHILEQFIDLLRESVIIQGLLALAVIVIIGHAAFTGTFGELPKEFWLVTGSIIGYYFKAKNDFQIQKMTKDYGTLVRELAETAVSAHEK